MSDYPFKLPFDREKVSKGLAECGLILQDNIRISFGDDVKEFSVSLECLSPELAKKGPPE